jgi:hypothetical protein
MLGVGDGVYVCRLTTTTQIVLDLNFIILFIYLLYYSTLLTLAIQSVRASSEVTH